MTPWEYVFAASILRISADIESCSHSDWSMGESPLHARPVKGLIGRAVWHCKNTSERCWYLLMPSVASDLQRMTDPLTHGIHEPTRAQFCSGNKAQFWSISSWHLPPCPASWCHLASIHARCCSLGTVFPSSISYYQGLLWCKPIPSNSCITTSSGSCNLQIWW